MGRSVAIIGVGMTNSGKSLKPSWESDLGGRLSTSEFVETVKQSFLAHLRADAA